MQRFSIRTLSSLAGILLLSSAAFAGAASPAIVAVPEIDPGTAGGGLALLGIGAIFLIEQYRRRQFRPSPANEWINDLRSVSARQVPQLFSTLYRKSFVS